MKINNKIVVAVIAVLTSLNSNASPYIVGELYEPEIKRDFKLDVQKSLSKLNQILDQRSGLEKKAVLEYVDVIAGTIEQPTPLTKEILDTIICAESGSRFPFRSPLMECFDDITGKQIQPYFINFTGGYRKEPGFELLNYFYFLNLNPPDYRSWQIYRLQDLLSFVGSQRSLVSFNNDGSVELESVLDGNGVLRTVAKIRINDAEGVQYFESQLRPKFDLSLGDLKIYGEFTIKKKTKEIENGITYVNKITKSGIVVSIAETFLGTGPTKINPLEGDPFPVVIKEVTCRGDCAVYDRSPFQDRVGVFTYPWQILFFSDTYSDFFAVRRTTDYVSRRSGYAYSLSLTSSNPMWFVWADMIAGNKSGNSLRGSLFFKKQFELLKFVE